MEDIRLPFTDKVIELLKERINEDNFKIALCISQNKETGHSYISINIRLIKVEDKEINCDISYLYQYRPFDYQIKEVNKKLKRKDKTLEEVVARECYDGFMSWWIGLAKKSISKE